MPGGDNTTQTLAKSSQRGFTIVELLIVVIVIAILAAITIVAYNGVTNTAKASAAQTAAEQAAKKVLVYMTTNADQVPQDLATAGVSDQNGTTYQYSANTSASPPTFCLTATTSNISYYVDNSTHTTPTAGACAGQAPNGGIAVTNLIHNPGSEVAAWGIYDAGGNGGVSKSTTMAHSGVASTLLTKGSNYTYASAYRGLSYPGGLGSAGQVLTYSAWVYSSVPTIRIVMRGTNIHYNSDTQSKLSIPAGQWTRVSQTFSVPSGGSDPYIDIGWEATDAPTGSTAYLDDAMAVIGGSVYNFADGDSPGWAWTGTPNNSTSTGPAL